MCRWSSIVESVRRNVPADFLLDATLEVAARNETGTSLATIRSRALIMPDGGYVAAPDMVLGHGFEKEFPTGLYVVQIVVTDQHGLTGDVVVGMCSSRRLCGVVVLDARHMVEVSALSSSMQQILWYVCFRAIGDRSRGHKQQEHDDSVNFLVLHCRCTGLALDCTVADLAI